ncbi:MAG: F0F1 ATP synthase subunit delta [Clostridiales bacterium]|nr:F0F1 ATP synthase subunit delta [Clostridiales bacterium]
MVDENMLKLAGDFTEQDIERIRSGFSKMLGREIRFKVVRDDSLIGGFSAFINGKVYDASVLARIEDMQRQFTD